MTLRCRRALPNVKCGRVRSSAVESATAPRRWPDRPGAGLGRHARRDGRTANEALGAPGRAMAALDRPRTGLRLIVLYEALESSVELALVALALALWSARVARGVAPARPRRAPARSQRLGGEPGQLARAGRHDARHRAQPDRARRRRDTARRRSLGAGARRSLGGLARGAGDRLAAAVRRVTRWRARRGWRAGSCSPRTPRSSPTWLGLLVAKFQPRADRHRGERICLHDAPADGLYWKRFHSSVAGARARRLTLASSSRRATGLSYRFAKSLRRRRWQVSRVAVGNISWSALGDRCARGPPSARSGARARWPRVAPGVDLHELAVPSLQVRELAQGQPDLVLLR